MAVSATILRPLQGDTVQTDNVVINVYYSGCNGEMLIDTIAANYHDTATAENGDGLLTGTKIMGVPTGTQVVATGIANGGGTAIATELDHQDGVKVAGPGVPTPVPIMPPIPVNGEERGKKKLEEVKGDKIPAGSTAAYVVCQVIEVQIATPPVRTIVAIGATLATAGNTWKVIFACPVEIKAAKNLQYVARAFVYDNNNTLIGSESIPIKK